MRIVCSWLLALTTICATPVLFAQNSTSGSESNPTSGNSAGNPGRGGNDPGSNRGGGAQADFSQLMNLITQTVTPTDRWTDGSNTMTPYFNGVFVDPKGQLKRSAAGTINRSVENRLKKSATDAAKGDNAWLDSSDLRMVSLKRLDRALVDAAAGRKQMTAEIIRLGGINRISYVLIDSEAEDIILAGPADPNQMGFLLEDLAVVSALVNHQTTALGCSIDPNQQRLLDTQKFISQPNSSAMLSKSPARFAEQLGKTIGNYDVQIFGMNPKCSTAVALVSADEQMKMLGFGKVAFPVSIKSYFDHLESQNTVPAESMIRWWFAYNDLQVTSNPTGTLYGLPENCVQVLSEQQFVTQNGRKPTGKNDPAADAFAAEMSERMNELRNCDPSFSRLCCVFESALALQVALGKVGMANYRPWFPNLCGLGSFESAKAIEPKTVNGLVTTHVLKKKKTNIAVISGGVTVSPKTALKPENIKVSAVMTGSAVPDNSKTPANSAWWWD